MENSSDKKKEDSKQVQEELEIRQGARQTPGGSNESTRDDPASNDHKEGVEQDGSIKNTK